MRTFSQPMESTLSEDIGFHYTIKSSGKDAALKKAISHITKSDIAKSAGMTKKDAENFLSSSHGRGAAESMNRGYSIEGALLQYAGSEKKLLAIYKKTVASRHMYD